LIATDANWILDELQAALGGRGSSFTVCRSGKQVVPAVKASQPDLAILDLQIGTMGGMAVTMELRLEESGGRLPHVPVLMLLDRQADVFLASRAGAEGWLIKPLDSLRLRKAATTVTSGGTYYEGVPSEAAAPAEDTPEPTGEQADVAESADGAEALSG
jgi:DNA-binding response OmpR family regulator